MAALLEPNLIGRLNGEIDSVLAGDTEAVDRERAARRIQITMAGIARKLNLHGEVKMFGSYSNGFKTGGSDLDIVFSGTFAPESIVSILAKFAKDVSLYGYENITTIFSANVPLVKFTDKKAVLEVDFCINNDLGVRNSQLLATCCQCDHRVLTVGRAVKDWAKRHDLVGTADGFLNSYAYMLLALHYLQQLTPPVLPNLQELGTESVPITDHKWGCEDIWETKFLEDVQSLPPSENTQSVAELVTGFFHFYTREFDWRKFAVCIRAAGAGVRTDKFSLTTATNDDQWFIEDPFDLKHNLAGKCSRAGRKHILEEMSAALQALTTTGSWKQACPDASQGQGQYFLKCRISQAVTPQAMLEEFEEFELFKLHFPKADGSGRMGQAFLEFNSPQHRRQAHTKNETYVADCQLQLHYSSAFGLAEVVNQAAYSTYEMASYKMKKQILAARVQATAASKRHSADPSQPQPHAAYHEAPPMMPGNMGMGMMPPHIIAAQHVPQYPFSQPPSFPIHAMQGRPLQPQGPPHHTAAPRGWDVPMGMGMMPNQQQQAVPKRVADQPMPKAPKGKAVAVAKSANAPPPPKAGQLLTPEVPSPPKVEKLVAPEVPPPSKLAKLPTPQPPQVPQVAKESKSRAAPRFDSSGWLNVKIRDDMPKDKELLSPELLKRVEDLQAYFCQFRGAGSRSKDEHRKVVVQCELRNSIKPPHKMLSDEQMNDVNEFHTWLKNNRKS